ncbi:unnamed protein product [Sphagnum compactum]
MSSTSGEEVPIEALTQGDRELNLVSRFDFYIVQNGSQRGAAILRFLGFGVVRSLMEQEPGLTHQSCRSTATTLPTLRRIVPAFSERQEAIPRLGDIWVPKSAISPNHFVRLFIPGIEDLFQEGDRVIRVEHSGSRSRLIGWRVWRTKEGEWKFQQESTDEQKFSTVPAVFPPLKPIHEGVQAEFDGMTSPQGMDELFWGQEHEDVSDWAERLTMAAEVRDFNADKLFKIAKLNLRGRAREWLRRLQPAPADWTELRTLILLKYGKVDDDDVRAKLDAIKQEPRERVQSQ